MVMNSNDEYFFKSLFIIVFLGLVLLVVSLLIPIVKADTGIWDPVNNTGVAFFSSRVYGTDNTWHPWYNNTGGSIWTYDWTKIQVKLLNPTTGQGDWIWKNDMPCTAGTCWGGNDFVGMTDYRIFGSFRLSGSDYDVPIDAIKFFVYSGSNMIQATCDWRPDGQSSNDIYPQLIESQYTGSSYTQLWYFECYHLYISQDFSPVVIEIADFTGYNSYRSISINYISIEDVAAQDSNIVVAGLDELIYQGQQLLTDVSPVDDTSKNTLSNLEGTLTDFINDHQSLDSVQFNVNQSCLAFILGIFDDLTSFTKIRLAIITLLSLGVLIFIYKR